MPCLITVAFRQTTLYLVDEDGRPFVPMKPIMLGMRLSWSIQQTRLRMADACWGAREILLPGDITGLPALCLPLHKLFAWLITARPYRAKPARHEDFHVFQTTCDDVLWEIWSHHQPLSPTFLPGV